METRQGQRDFSGGLNVNPLMQEGELREATNINLDETGAVRPAFADTLVQAGINITCTRILDGAIYHNIGFNLFKDGVSIGTIGAGVFYAAKQGDVHIIIASDKVWKVIDDTLYQLGLNAPTVAPAVASTGSGPLTGSYNIQYSYVAKFTLPDGTAYTEESALSPISVIVPSAQKIDVSSIVDSISSDTADQVTHKRVYISGGGLAGRYRAAEILASDNAFLIEDTEAVLVELPIEDCANNNPPPLKPDYGIYLNGILFIATGKSLDWSRSLIPGAFPAENNNIFSYAIKALVERGPNLGVLMQDQEVLYINPGFGPLNGGYIYYSENPQGCISSLSSAKGYYASDEGISYFPGQEPLVISQRIRNELLSNDLSNSVGAYLRGSYFLCIPATGVMYEYDFTHNRFLKYTGVTFVASGDDGKVYIIKTDGIYSLETDTSQRKAFAFRSTELIGDKDTQFRHVVLDAYLGADGLDFEFYLNDVAQPSVNKSNTKRELIHFPITQEAGSRVAARVSSSVAITDTNVGIFGIYLKGAVKNERPL